MEPQPFAFYHLILAILNPALGGKLIPSFAGPYRIITRRIIHEFPDDVAGDRLTGIRGYVSSYRPRFPQYIHGSEYNDIPLGDNINVTINIDTRSNNQWKKNSFVMKFYNFCSDSQKHAMSLRKLVFGTDKEKCPVPVGRRTIKNQTIDLTFPSVPVFPYGHWLMTMHIGDKTSRIIGAISAEFETMPRV